MPNPAPRLFHNLPQTLILASASPRRRELLASLGLEFSVVPSRAEETPLDDEPPRAHVLRLSHDKALEVARRDEVAGRWFLGSDTIVVQDGQLLGKPADDAQAADMLRALQGRRHEVYSGFAVHDRHTGQTLCESQCTRVRFRELTAVEIAGYIATGEPRDKAGAYAIQGLGAYLVRDIEGSYTNVVGLPLSEVVDVLLTLGAIVPAA
ncbi:Maf family protein [Geoalkalibacter halelectricus]|uniref:dTTP/UTP pyrophosphatase n=1 Tax=Geoalkalibacter halelectricus TaxID=2847045 RepID=A0ABY5ZNQ5_9BACT|nr:Maf family protein [Geoalkalibacter halelectricus]MDO3377464.1 Maf family protein [Geoalkalibacter halelectricus]UWZ80777.1 Maf family protein [Geoalkalibacter halelectricus]